MLSGWVNADQEPSKPECLGFDATKRFPFDDAEFQLVFSEHMIEHMSYDDGAAMLAECHRVLKPGGRIRVTTPDINFLIKLYLGPRTPLEESYVHWAARVFDPRPPAGEAALFVFNRFVRAWGHLFIYDPPALSRLLTQTGFVDIQSYALGESHVPELRNLENVERLSPGFLQLESFTLEATKPR